MTSHIFHPGDDFELPPPSDHTMFCIQPGTETELPIRKKEIRFAILYRNGCTSNAWGVRTEKSKEAYIYCRDNMQDQHVSLHASGKRHIVTKPDRPSAGNLKKQFMNQWRGVDEKTPTFKLVFPWWGVQINAENRKKNANKWKKNDVFIEGHHKFLTIVEFFITGTQVKFNKKDKLPGFVLGETPLEKLDKKLVITAAWCPEPPNFQSNIREALKQAVHTIEESYEELYDGEDLDMCMTGTDGSPDSVFMVNFPVEYNKL